MTARAARKGHRKRAAHAGQRSRAARAGNPATTAPFDAEAVARAAKARADNGTEAKLARAASLDSIAYDRERAAIARKLKIRVTTLDDERARRRGAAPGAAQDDDAPGLVRAAPAPWPEPVDGAALLDALARAIASYVVMAPGMAQTVALWVVHAHAIDASAISPRLAITSPEKGCGKTTTLDVLEKLAPRTLLAANMGAAVVFRVMAAARPTLLIDEADTFLDKDDGALRGILNSGHRRGGAVIRCVGDDHTPQRFATFGACAIAKIGRLPATLEDRAVAIELRRARPGEVRASFRYDRTPELDQLARQAARFAADAGAALADADPALPPGLHNRAADNWRPLLAIADAAGGAWPARMRDVAMAAVGARRDDGSARTRLLADIRAVFAEAGVDRITSAALCAALATREESPWGEWSGGKAITPTGVAKLLAPFGVGPQSIRLAGGATPKGYALESFADAFVRYLRPDAPLAATPPHASKSADSASATAATSDTVLRLLFDENPRLAAGCGGVAAAAPESGAGPREDGEL
jgi:putative DNA primase/helicase